MKTIDKYNSVTNRETITIHLKVNWMM